MLKALIQSPYRATFFELTGINQFHDNLTTEVNYEIASLEQKIDITFTNTIVSNITRQPFSAKKFRNTPRVVSLAV